MKKNIFKVLVLVALITMGVCIVKYDTTTVQAAEKRLQGGRSKSSAKSISSNNNYIVRVRGEQTMWYKFKTPKYQTYASLYAKNLSAQGAFSVSIYSKYDEEMMKSNNLYKNADELAGYDSPLKKNTWYYIKLEYYYNSTGNVKFSLKINKDTVADTMSHAHKIKIKKSYISSIDGYGDTDWYKFKPSKSGNYTFNLRNMNNESDVYGYVVSKYEEELGYCYAYKGSSDSFSVKLRKNQWYYIRIDSGYKWGGKYRFSIT